MTKLRSDKSIVRESVQRRYGQKARIDSQGSITIPNAVYGRLCVGHMDNLRICHQPSGLAHVYLAHYHIGTVNPYKSH